MKKLTILLVAMLLCAGEGAVHHICCTETLRVGILPFHIYSSENVDYLQGIISARLAERMARREYIAVVERPPSLEQVSYRDLSQDDLDQLTRTLGADYLVYGSLTLIENEISIDARAFTLLPQEKTFRSFVVGTDFDRLVLQTENKIAEHLYTVLAKATSPEGPIVVEKPLTEHPLEVTELPEKQIAHVAGEAKEMAPMAKAQAVEMKEKFPPAVEEARAPSEPSAATIGTPGLEPPAVSEPIQPASKTAPPASPSPTPTPRAAAATETGTKKPPSQFPFNITSNRMEADNRNLIVTFFGDVKATSEDLIVISDKMSVVYSKEREIEQVTAGGNVKINKKDLTASCQMAKLLHGEQKIILTGKPKVWQGNNMVSGERIEIFLEQDRIVVEGKKDRVNVVIYPKSKDKE